ncbi:MAG: SCP2 sterol-binding domain-containing protein [Cellvibrionales bacterium]|nr:SCP2 sterol-binding domain-containing protein [Cellvibrionales bacterium]
MAWAERVLRLLNRALAALLDSDPANAAALESLDGRCIAVACTAPPLHFVLYIESPHIRVAAPTDKAADLRICGTLDALLRWLTAPADSAAGGGHGIDIAGDAGLLLAAQRLVRQLEVDWEALLAERVGDAAAVLLTDLMHGVRSGGRRLRTEFERGVQAQVERHSQSLPGRAELQAAQAHLADLHRRLDYLDAGAER